MSSVKVAAIFFTRTTKKFGGEQLSFPWEVSPRSSPGIRNRLVPMDHRRQALLGRPAAELHAVPGLADLDHVTRNRAVYQPSHSSSGRPENVATEVPVCLKVGEPAGAGRVNLMAQNWEFLSDFRSRRF